MYAIGGLSKTGMFLESAAAFVIRRCFGAGSRQYLLSKCIGYSSDIIPH